jgi:MFS family permease
MAAWAVRSLLFATLSFPLIVLGLLLHGFAYCFVFVGAYIFVDKKAPQDLKASAQSFISFLMLGVGMLLGSLLSGATIDQYPPYVGTMSAAREIGEGAELERTQLARTGLPAWSDIASQLDMGSDDAIALDNLGAKAAQGLKVEDKTFAKKHVMVYPLADLEKVLMKIDDRKEIRTRGDFRSAMDPAVAISVNHSDWIAAQLHHWTPMWLWFSLAAGVICVFFAVGSMFTSDEEPAAAPPPKPQPQPAEPAQSASPVEWLPQETPPPPAPEDGPQPPA